MFWQLFFLISSSHAIQQTLKEPTCNIQGTSRTIRLSVNSTRSPIGVWLDNLSAWTEFSSSSDGPHMDIAHTITECQGKRMMHIQTVSHAPTYERLMFHPICGKNAAILNKGLSIQRINLDDPYNAIVFTNRPMKDDEIFEVKIEGKNTKFTGGLGIGIMTKSPTDVDILSEMYKSPFAFMYLDVNIYSNGVAVLKNYGKDVYKLQVGDRIGVMRSGMGTLHFFINEEDQGPAMPNVPSNVYGVFEVRGNTDKASIFYRSS